MSFDLQALEKRLKKLPAKHRAAFAAVCTERMLPNYATFTRTCRWGEPKFLRGALEEVYEALTAAKIDSDELRKIKAECEKAVPDLDEFSDETASWAADAGNALVATFECLLTGDAQQALACASAAKDTVDNFIQEQAGLSYRDPVMQGKLDDDPLLTREMSRQQYTLDALEKAKALDAAFLKKLRAEFGGGGKSNINLDWREHKRK